jgi:hypothetical protein
LMMLYHNILIWFDLINAEGYPYKILDLVVVVSEFRVIFKIDACIDFKFSDLYTYSYVNLF